MLRKKVVVIDSHTNSYVSDTGPEASILGNGFEVEVLKVAKPEELVGRLGGVHGIISWHLVPLTTEVIESLDACEVIVRAAVGFDNIDVQTARARGIEVCNVPDYGTEEVADHAMAMLLALARRLKSTDEHVSKGGWNWNAIGNPKRIRGTTLGIVGFGRIGSALSVRAKAFGLDVLFYDPYVASGIEKSFGVRRTESLQELLAGSDWISLHAPLNPATRDLVSAREMQAMKPGAVLINSARGGLVHTPSLIDALDSGQVGAAGLDVVAEEPHIPAPLLLRSNVIISPHSAFYSTDSIGEIRHKSAWNIRRHFARQHLRDRVEANAY